MFDSPRDSGCTIIREIHQGIIVIYILVSSLVLLVDKIYEYRNVILDKNSTLNLFLGWSDIKFSRVWSCLKDFEARLKDFYSCAKISYYIIFTVKNGFYSNTVVIIYLSKIYSYAFFHIPIVLFH